ncbi:MAG: hypothetical protein CM15mP120_15140 [Pseudomonadota bacterium]|nr:MAG: hypothetical protein CM15mP120_15140 [Pseudomonadota bacterium]
MHLAVTTLLGRGPQGVALFIWGTPNFLGFKAVAVWHQHHVRLSRGPAGFSAAIQDNTKLVFGEVLGNLG